MADVTRQQITAGIREIKIPTIKRGKIMSDWMYHGDDAQFNIEYVISMPKSKKTLNELKALVDKIKRDSFGRDINSMISIEAEALPKDMIQFTVRGSMGMDIEVVVSNNHVLPVTILTMVMVHIGEQLENKFLAEGMLRN